MRATRRGFIEATAAGVASTAAGCQGIAGDTPTEDSPAAENEPSPTTETRTSNRDGEGNEERSSRSVAPGEDIQAALDAIPAGGRVIVEPGEHVIDRPLFPPSSSRLTVRGTIRLADGMEATDEVDARIVNPREITGFILEGPGTLDGNKENVPYSGKRQNHPGIRVRDSRRVIIRNIEIKNVVAGASISTAGSTDVTYRNIYCHSHSKEGAPCDAMWFGDVENALIQGNSVQDVTDTYYAMDHCRGIRLENNYATQTEQYIDDKGGSAQCATCYSNQEQEFHGVIRNNFFDSPHNVANAAITTFSLTENDTTVHITGNRIINANNGAIGLHSNLEESVVTDNIITGSETFGIEVFGTDTTVAGNTVSDASTFGIAIRGEGGSLTNNQVVGAGVDGMVIQDNATVDGNRITDAGLAGIRLVSGTTGASVTDNHVSGGSPNVLLQAEVTQCLLANNVLESASTVGISANATSDDNVFEGNIMRENQSGAWDVPGNDNSTFANNQPAYGDA